MFPISIEFTSPHLKIFQIKKFSGRATVAELISIHKLNDLIKKAAEIGKLISYTVYLQNRKNIIKYTTSIRTDDDEFYFTIICLAWMIDRELKWKNLITFDFEFESFKPDNIFEVDGFLNLESNQETFIEKQYVYLKEKIAIQLADQIRRYWENNNIKYYLIETTYKKDKLIIKSRKNFSLDLTDKNLISIVFILIFFVSCGLQRPQDCVGRTLQGPWGGTTLSYDDIVFGCEKGWFDN